MPMNMYNREDGTSYIVIYRSAFRNSADFDKLCKSFNLPITCWKIEIDIIVCSAIGYFADKKREITYANCSN